MPHRVATASLALVDILRILADRDLARVQALADAVRTSKRSLIARTSAEVNPARPDLARAASFAGDWVVGLNISNREKMAVIRAACAVFDIRMPDDLAIVLPNGG